MKQTLTTFFLLFTLCALTFGQNPRDRVPRCEAREKIEAQRIAFITQKLSLTPEEAQLFWPIYNELEKKKKELREQSRKLFHSEQNEKTDKELSDMSDKLIEIRLKHVMLEKEYHSKYKKVLSPHKILKLYHSEKQFHKVLLRKIKERKGCQFQKKHLDSNKY